MRLLRVWMSRLRGLFRGRTLDRDLHDQIGAHLEEATEDYLRQGFSAAEARRLAHVAFGNVVLVEADCREARGMWRNDLSRDVTYGWRMLRRNPAFATIAVLSLALGIGANSAIFSLVNSMLLRPRPVAHPEQLVELHVGEREQPYETTSYPSYVEFRDRNGVLSGLAAYNIRQFTFGDANTVEHVWGEVVTGNYFDVLGVQPVLGRAFAAEEDRQPGRNPVVVISHGLWQRRFHADPDVVGRAVTINNHALTVIGVAPRQYTGSVRGFASQLWVPAMMLPVLEPSRDHFLTDRGSRWLALVGRLNPDTTVEQAQTRFDLLSREMQATHPEEWRSIRSETGRLRELFVTVVAERDARIHPDLQLGAYAVVALLVVIVNVVLLIACLNLANMLLARAVMRRKEMAVRLAVGASRWRLVRQLIAESVLLALIAGALGVVMASWCLNLLLANIPMLPEGIRTAIDVQLDWRVLAYTMGFATLTGVLFGLAPALQSSKTDVSTVVKDNSTAFAGGYRRSRVRAALVVSQVACSLLLLIAAGLVLRSLDKVRPTRLGFTSENIVVASLTLDQPRYDRGRSQAFYRQVSERVLALPGVQAVSLVDVLPGGFLNRRTRGTEIEGYQQADGESVSIDASFVSPRYFTNMKVPIVEGRDFDERDREGAPCVAIVNEAFRQRYFATGGALGKHLTKLEGAEAPTKQLCEIVGVIRDNHWQSLQKTPRPFYAMALLQTQRTRISLFVHTAADPATQIAAVRGAVLDLDPNLPVTDVETLNGFYGAIAYPFRLLGLILGACGISALLLATIGVYGIVSYAVAQRTREVGIRMALGALHREILSMIVGHAMTLVTRGLLLGLLLGVALARVLSSDLFFGRELLFGVSATDSLTFAGVTMLLALVALAACCIPALRATRVDPIETLRNE